MIGNIAVNERDGLEILNIEELVQYFSYLKRLPKYRMLSS